LGYKATKKPKLRMADRLCGRRLISNHERGELVQPTYDYPYGGVEKSFGPKMSYRGRAAGVMLKAVRDLGLEVPEIDIARAAGFDKRTMATNTDIIDALLKDSST